MKYVNDKYYKKIGFYSLDLFVIEYLKKVIYNIFHIDRQKIEININAYNRKKSKYNRFYKRIK